MLQVFLLDKGRQEGVVCDMMIQKNLQHNVEVELMAISKINEKENWDQLNDYRGHRREKLWGLY